MTTPPCPAGFDTRGSSTWTRTKAHLVFCSTPGSRVCDYCAILRHNLYTEILGATTLSFRWYLVVVAWQDWQTHIRLVAEGKFGQSPGSAKQAFLCYSIFFTPDMKAPRPSAHRKYPVVCYHNFSKRRVWRQRNPKVGNRDENQFWMKWDSNRGTKGRSHQRKLKPHRRGL